MLLRVTWPLGLLASWTPGAHLPPHMPTVAQAASTFLSSEGQDLYSPTSPAGSASSHSSEALRSGSKRAADVDENDDLPELKRAKGEWEHRTIEKTEDAAKVERVPELICGTRLDKVCPLKPNRWTKIGRSAGAQLLLKNSGVSRLHCQLRWNTHDRVVELRDTSNTGTVVNDDVLKGARRFLAHGDRLRVEGKGIRFDFILDLRPVGLATCDPRKVNRDAPKEEGIFHQKETLRAQLEHIEGAIATCQARAFDKEQEYHELTARRRVRVAEEQAKEEQIKKFVKDTERLTKTLADSRQAWMEKTRAEQEKNEAHVRPLTEETAQIQMKLEKLQLKKIELERSLHPDKFAIADVGHPVSGGGSPNRDGRLQLRPPSEHGDEEDEMIFDVGAKETPKSFGGVEAIEDDEALASEMPSKQEPGFDDVFEDEEVLGHQSFDSP